MVKIVVREYRGIFSRVQQYEWVRMEGRDGAVDHVIPFGPFESIAAAVADYQSHRSPGDPEPDME